jgi:hypothetical protein
MYLTVTSAKRCQDLATFGAHHLDKRHLTALDHAFWTTYKVHDIHKISQESLRNAP